MELNVGKISDLLTYTVVYIHVYVNGEIVHGQTCVFWIVISDHFKIEICKDVFLIVPDTCHLAICACELCHPRHNTALLTNGLDCCGIHAMGQQKTYDLFLTVLFSAVNSTMLCIIWIVGLWKIGVLFLWKRLNASDFGVEWAPCWSDKGHNSF